MSQEPAVIMHEKPYTIEVGHSKSGSSHVLIIKKIRVSGDNLDEVIEMLQRALQEFENLSVE
jgi:hypothetical protein